MFSLRGKQKTAGKKASEPRKELQRLKRQDLLELLLEQMRDNDALRDELDASEATAENLNALAERLKAKLDDKDELIVRLKGRLDEKDILINQVFQLAGEMAHGGKLAREEAFAAIEELITSHMLHRATDHAPAVYEPEPESELAAGPEPVAELEPEPIPAPKTPTVDELDQELPPVYAIPTLGFEDEDADHLPAHLSAQFYEDGAEITTADTSEEEVSS